MHNHLASLRIPDMVLKAAKPVRRVAVLFCYGKRDLPDFFMNIELTTMVQVSRTFRTPEAPTTAPKPRAPRAPTTPRTPWAPRTLRAPTTPRRTPNNISHLL